MTARARPRLELVASMVHDSRGHRILRALLAGQWTAAALAEELEEHPVMRSARRGQRHGGGVHSTSRTIGKLRRGELGAPDLSLALALQEFNVPAGSWYEAPSKATTVAASGGTVSGGG